MSVVVTTGAALKCTFGAAPSNFKATNNPMVRCGGKVVGTISDGAANINIQPFGLCSSMANPQVAAATAAALGVLQPQQCIPQTQAWIPAGKAILVGGKPCLTQDCKCMCAYAGEISVVRPGQMTVRTS